MNRRHVIFIMILLLMFAILYLVMLSAKPKYIKISAKDAKEIILEDPDFEIIDTRSKEEYIKGHIPESISLPMIDINEAIYEVLPNKDDKIIVYGEDDDKSKLAAKQLLSFGYIYVYDLGSIDNWIYNIEK